MSCTVVFYHDTPGESLTLTLRNNAGAIVNSGGTSFTEGSGLRYTASVSQALAGWYIAQIYDADDDVIYTGSVKVANDSGSYRIDDPQAGIPPAAPSASVIATAVWEATERTLTEFDFPVDVAIDPELLQDALQDAFGDGVDVRSFSTPALAQLAGKTIVVSYTAIVNNQLQPPIVRGDTYSAAIGNPIDLSHSDWPDLPDGTAIKLKASQKRTGQAFDVDGSVIVGTGAKVIRFEMTSAQTSGFMAGVYNFEIIATIPSAKPVHLVGPETTLRVLDGL